MEDELQVKMSGYDWHCLLAELEFGMQVYSSHGNHSQPTCIRLYESIGSQLAGVSVVVSRPEPSEPPPNNSLKRTPPERELRLGFWADLLKRLGI